jgi:hypothetical protein
MSTRIDWGSARVSRPGDGVPAVADSPFTMQPAPPNSLAIKDRFGVTPNQHARRARYPIFRTNANPR